MEHRGTGQSSVMNEVLSNKKTMDNLLRRMLFLPISTMCKPPEVSFTMWKVEATFRQLLPNLGLKKDSSNVHVFRKQMSTDCKEKFQDLVMFPKEHHLPW